MEGFDSSQQERYSGQDECDEDEWEIEQNDDSEQDKRP
jgi:hypothetical protein